MLIGRKIKEKWLENSPGKLKENKVIAFRENHFEQSQVIKNDNVLINGELVSIPYKRAFLRNDSIPSIFHVSIKC